jgi:hypothetical protein
LYRYPFFQTGPRRWSGMLPLPMKYLVLLLVISVGASLVVAVAVWLRLRWHLRRSDEALKNTLAEIQPEHEQAEAE